MYPWILGSTPHHCNCVPLIAAPPSPRLPTHPSIISQILLTVHRENASATHRQTDGLDRYILGGSPHELRQLVHQGVCFPMPSPSPSPLHSSRATLHPYVPMISCVDVPNLVAYLNRTPKCCLGWYVVRCASYNRYRCLGEFTGENRRTTCNKKIRFNIFIVGIFCKKCTCIR
jgi:hypothetical protein